jgi:hypothetical protein
MALLGATLSTVDTTTFGGAGGAILQSAMTTDSTKKTGSTVILNDDTIPQKTEGNLFLTAAAFTPTAADSTLFITVSLNLENSTNNLCGSFVTRDAVASAIGGALQIAKATVEPFTLSYQFAVAAGSTDARTYKVYAGATAGTMTFNGLNNVAKWGGILSSSIRIDEIAA